MSLTYTTILEEITCVSCGILFAVPHDWEKRRRADHAWFYCPAGHHLHFPSKSPEEKLRDRLKVTESTITHLRDQRDAAERSARSYRGHVTRLRNRIRNGVCPWCSRHFSNVMRHVETKHPEHIEKAREAE